MTQRIWTRWTESLALVPWLFDASEQCIRVFDGRIWRDATSDETDEIVAQHGQEAPPYAGPGDQWDPSLMGCAGASTG